VQERKSGGRAARYVAIITDGNGRWAKRRGLPVLEGHRAGAENLRARLYDAAAFGIKEITVFAFSTENWARSEAEVSGLMSLIALYIERETPDLHKHGVRMRFTGRRENPVPVNLLERIEWAEKLTAGNDLITLMIPLNYGGRAEIVDAARAFDGGTEADFRAHLYAPDMHDPDIVIRTSGEQRLSNYMLWQTADAELVFREELWPDFDRTAFEAVLEQFEAGSKIGDEPRGPNPTLPTGELPE
jgi:undecaprenyl diphosphate synthase